MLLKLYRGWWLPQRELLLSGFHASLRNVEMAGWLFPSCKQTPLKKHLQQQSHSKLQAFEVKRAVEQRFSQGVCVKVSAPQAYLKVAEQNVLHPLGNYSFLQLQEYTLMGLPFQPLMTSGFHNTILKRKKINVDQSIVKRSKDLI